jgi:hypothetical protein
MLTTIASLEKESELLREELKDLVFPCPECRKDIKGTHWTDEEGGECPHCHIDVTPEEMHSLILRSRDLWQKLCATNRELSEAKQRAYVHELRSKGLPAWRTFLHRRFLWDEFTDPLYLMLSRTFGHIAQYDRRGFFTYHFSTLEATLRTLDAMVNFSRKLSGSYAELEESICDEITDGEYLTTLRKLVHEETEVQDRKKLAELKAKYEA